MRKATLTRQQGMRGFIIATVAFVSVFAASAVPVPLYSAYQAQFGLSNMDLTIMLLAYLAGVISMLLVFGRVSNAVGRRPIVRIALASSLIGCVLLMLADGAPMLYTGRLFQGIACGIGMGNVASSAIDCRLAKSLPRSATMTTGIESILIDITVGSVASSGKRDFA